MLVEPEQQDGNVLMSTIWVLKSTPGGGKEDAP
jgi:hypothetical protein